MDVYTNICHAFSVLQSTESSAKGMSKFGCYAEHWMHKNCGGLAYNKAPAADSDRIFLYVNIKGILFILAKPF